MCSLSVTQFNSQEKLKTILKYLKFWDDKQRALWYVMVFSQCTGQLFCSILVLKNVFAYSSLTRVWLLLSDTKQIAINLMN